MKSKKRFEIMKQFAYGKILDVGYYEIPNTELQIDVGIDKKIGECPENYKEIIKMNCEEMQFPDKSFDTILASEVYEHLERPIDFLRECKRVLKPKGRLVLSTPNPYYVPIIISRILQIKKFTRNDHISETNIQYMYRNFKNTGFRVIERVGTRFDYHIIYVCKRVE